MNCSTPVVHGRELASFSRCAELEQCTRTARGTFVADAFDMRPINKIGRVDSLHAAIAIALLSGCLDEATSTQTPTTARERWNQQAWPALGACVGCHGSQPALDFLAPNTVEGAYATVFEFQPPVIDVGAPSSSLLLTMGKHTGPALDPNSAAMVLGWLEAERDERVPDMGESVRVGPFLPVVGMTQTVELGVGGASIAMFAEAGELGIYMSKLTLSGGSGVRVAHPLFVSRPRNPVIDETDRFADLDVVLAAGESIELGPAAFLSFATNEYLTIHFKTLEAP